MSIRPPAPGCPPCRHNARRDLFIAAASGARVDDGDEEAQAAVEFGEKLLKAAGE